MDNIFDFPSLNIGVQSNNNNDDTTTTTTTVLSFEKLLEINKENEIKSNDQRGSFVQPVIIDKNEESTRKTKLEERSKKKKRNEETSIQDPLFFSKLQSNILKSRVKDLTIQLKELQKKHNISTTEINGNGNGNGNTNDGDEIDKEFNELKTFLDRSFSHKSKSSANNEKITEIFDEKEESEMIEKIDSILYETFRQLEPYQPSTIEKSNGYYFLEKLVKGFSKTDKIKSDQKKLSVTGIRIGRQQKSKRLLNYINLLKSNLEDTKNPTQLNYYCKELEKKSKEYHKLSKIEKQHESSGELNEEEDREVVVEPSKEREEIQEIVNEKNCDLQNKLLLSKRCYICKVIYKTIHGFYDGLCWSCAEFNLEKRNSTTDLSGRIAIVTGSRIKIGYETTLKLLRSGCTVIATSRFPTDTAIRFSLEKDFKEWSSKLHVYALNLCDLKSLELFCTIIKSKFPSINIIINNAAQTIKKPVKFYEILLSVENIHSPPIECKSILSHFNEIKSQYLKNNGIIDKDILGIESSSHGTGENKLIESISNLSLIKTSNINDTNNVYGNDSEIDLGKCDEHGQPIDNRESNSWTQKAFEVPLIELIEAHAISAFSPFIMFSHFYPEIKKSSIEHGSAFIINVNAMEGKFSRFYKSPNHAHTNMSKSSQNMFTRTSACDLSLENIYMNSVDTGWVTDENPLKSPSSSSSHDSQWQPPLDEIDGAARILDPIYSGLRSNNCLFGLFFKDYKPVSW